MRVADPPSAPRSMPIVALRPPPAYAPRRPVPAPASRARQAVEMKMTSDADGMASAPPARRESLAFPALAAPQARAGLRAALGVGCLMRLVQSNDGAAAFGLVDAAPQAADVVALASAALALIADPAAIIDPRGEIVGFNEAFQARRALFKPLLAALAETDAAAREGEARYDAATGAAAAVFPLRDAFGAERGKLILLRAPIATPRCCEPATLETAFGLTPAEARLVCALMRTRSLSAANRELGLKDKTGRTYLDRVFQKTGARSQLQLYALLIDFYLLTRIGG